MYIYQSAVVKGLERDITCIYEARRLLLGLDSCDTANINTANPDLISPGGGLANYWLDLLLQQLHLSEQGEFTYICQVVQPYKFKKL